jgi:hypothetical protein
MVVAVVLALATVSGGGADSTNCKGTAAMAAAEPAARHILLQIVQAAPTTSEMLEAIVAAAAEIWAPYNVIVSPIYTLSRPDDRTRQWITLILRDQPANRIDGKAPRGHRAIASLTFTEDGPGNVIYASLEIARHSVQAAGIGQGATPVQERFAAQLLGQAIAHELGHYLLESSRHSRDGLMRASFGVADLMSQDLTRFRLSPEQAAVLAGPVSARCRARQAP